MLIATFLQLNRRMSGVVLKERSVSISKMSLPQAAEPLSEVEASIC